MNSLPPELQDLVERCLDSGSAAEWQTLHARLASEKHDAALLDAYAETCAVHHDLRCLLNDGASDAAFLRGVESALSHARKDSQKFVLDVSERASRQAETRFLKKKARSRIMMLSAAGVAALMLLAAGIYFATGTSSAALGKIVRASNGLQLVRGSQTRDVRTGETLQSGDVLRMSTGAAASDTDGTEVALDVQATLKFSGHTEAAFHREGPAAVDLTGGRMTVSVGPQPAGHPFIVHTPHADAEVLGTRFALDVTPDHTRLEVFESRVRLRQKAQPDGLVVQAGFAAEARPGVQAATVALGPEQFTAVFQEGRDGYAGTCDATITNQNAEFSNGNGNTQYDGDDMLICDLKEYQSSLLLRFEKLKLPPNAKVESAQLELHIENWITDLALRGGYVNGHWNYKARDLDGLGWLNRDKGNLWAAPGAADAKRDRIPNAPLAIPTAFSMGYEVSTTIPLDAARVQKWISSPESNDGMVFSIGRREDKTRVFTSHNSTQSRRPALIVRYSIQKP